MEEKLSHIICEELIKNDTVSREYEEVYVYGLEMVLSLLVNSTIILLIGTIIKQIDLTLIFLSQFMFLRRLTGGYHAKTRIQCRIFTLSSYIAVIVANKIIPVNIVSFVILGCLGIFMIIKFGPIENPNKPIDKKDYLKYKIFGLLDFIILYLISGLLIGKYEQFGTIIFYTLAIVIVLMIISVVKRKGGEQDEDNC